MKRVFLASFLSLFLFAGVASAQESGTGEIATSAEIVSGLSVINQSDMAFGSLVQGSSVTLDAQTGQTDNGSGSTSQGVLEIVGNAGETVSLSFAAEATMSGPTDAAALNVSTSLFTAPSNDASTSTAVADGDTVVLDTDGSNFLYIGGDLDIPGGQATGSYNGAYSVTATYTSI